jgi:hypothetical protein
MAAGRGNVLPGPPRDDQRHRLADVLHDSLAVPTLALDAEFGSLVAFNQRGWLRRPLLWVNRYYPVLAHMSGFASSVRSRHPRAPGRPRAPAERP